MDPRTAPISIPTPLVLPQTASFNAATFTPETAPLTSLAAGATLARLVLLLIGATLAGLLLLVGLSESRLLERSDALRLAPSATASTSAAPVSTRCCCLETAAKPPLPDFAAQTREFWLKLVQLILVNLLLPIVTAILGYMFGKS